MARGLACGRVDAVQQFVSVKEAAIHYGLSETEVRRRVASGRLVAERLTRPQGTLLRVMIDVPDETPTTHQDAPPRADSEETLSIIKALIQSHADTAARQGEMIAELREERGRLQAERDHALARAVDLERQLEQARQAAARSWWQRLLGIQS